MSEIFQEAAASWQNDEKAKTLALLEKGAASDDPDCLYWAGFLLQDGLAGRFDRARAFDYIERAATLGHLDAIYCLGYFYLSGGMSNLGYSKEILDQKRIVQDEAKGLALMRQAASEGHENAIFRMGRHHYYKSKDSPRNLQEALEWYARGIEAGEASCMVDLADMLVLGIAVDEDLERAKELYAQASRSERNPSAKNAATQRLTEFDSLKTILSDDR